MRSYRVVETLTDDSLMAPPTTSEYLGVPEATLAQWRYQGKGPRFFKVGKHVRYRKSDVDAWLEQQASQ
jgi:excisionase family DNA binding protein